MSWSGFKKNVGRATTQVMVKTGRVEKTSDREYEVEERRYRTLEASSLRLQKEAKGYLDSLRAMTASQMRIAETIDAFYGDSGAKDGVSRSYKQAVEDLDAETVKALDGPYRCVPESLYKFAEDEQVIKDIEEEWNFKAGNKRVYTRRDSVVHDSQDHGLMDYLYRTTVLEPINRFCAYFPDINECIKKRQHKMLDYDALRSKVKKLTEKPDKDPSKLPRTEKETEMVSPVNASFPPFPAYSSGTSEGDLELGLTIPSPPKALERPDIQKLRTVSRLSEQEHSASLIPTRMLLRPGKLPSNASSSMSTPRTSAATTNSDLTSRTIPQPGSSGGVFSPLRGSSIFRRSPSRILSTPFASGLRSSSFTSSSQNGNLVDKSQPTLKSTADVSHSGFITPVGRSSLSTPFFQPSELEDIMEPFKLEFAKKQADELAQAKAAYEQLNDQLTTELPQLIDLRVPYLDPTFEALVKIQLRFCAEAYSRMAQVQQYLDASTRDQYASGELDARVEDVLGQIRELSIAGTV